MTTLTQMLSGRKRESGIWEYFTYKADTDKSQCIIVLRNRMLNSLEMRVCLKINQKVLKESDFKE